MGMAFKSDACDVLLECDIVAHGERCDTHPHRRWGVMILDLRKRLAADLALHPNWEARARRFDGRSGIRTSMRSTPASRRPARVQRLRFAGTDMLGR